MATKQPFIQTPVDRTPYGACAAVVFIAGSIFVVGAFTLIRVGGILQRYIVKHQTPTISADILPTIDPFGSAQQELNSIEQTAQQSAKQAAQAQATAAVNQLQNAAQASVENNVDNLKNGIK